MIRLIEILAAGVTDDVGAPLANGTVTAYESGTTTQKTLFQEFALETPHPNPATLDAAGRLVAYVDGRTKLVIFDSEGTYLRTVDHVGTEDSDVSVSLAANLAGIALEETVDGELDVQVDGETITVNEDNQVQIPDDVRLPGNPGTPGDFEVGGALEVAGAAEITGALTAKDGIILDSDSKASIREGNATKIMVRKGGAAGERPIVVSADPSTAGLMVVAGTVSSVGAPVTGEGFSASRTAQGRYLITFTDAFAVLPAVVASAFLGGGGSSLTAMVDAVSTTVATVYIFNTVTSAVVDSAFHFHAIGQRGA